MTIDIQNGEIIILDDTKGIGAIEKSQLSFWNFSQNYIQNTFSARLDEQLFLKLTRYFEKEGIKFELKKEAKNYARNIQIVALNFESIKQTAKNFKNGKYDKLDFDLFRDFVAGNIKRSLKIHQLKAAYHLYLLGNGANFSVPGSGKTSVVLTVYEKLRLEGKVNTLFVVGPPSCFGPWKNEFIETLDRIPRQKILAGGDKIVRKGHYYDTSGPTSELYLTTYHSFLFDQQDVNYFLNQKHVKAFLVVDEAHYIKQVKGNWAQAILSQSEKAKFRCVLTGTPMPKSYSDVFNLFDFLWPKQNPIPKSDKTLITISEEQANRRDAKNVLINDIGPLFYRVRKTDLNLAPQNFLKPEQITMGYYERRIYDAVYTRIKDYSKEEFLKNVDFINNIGRGRIMRLRQCISYPKLLSTAVDNYEENLFEDLQDLKTVIRQYDKLEIPSKIKSLIKLVKNLRKRKLKVIIWSNFRETIKLIEEHMNREQFYCKKIFGDTPVEGEVISKEETREKIRDEFVDPLSGLDILIANPAACAESISLHKTCHHAIYYDLSYNGAQYLQSLDRIHRVGGSEDISANYHFLQYADTIDADIKNNVDLKREKMFEVIEEDYAIYSLNMFDPDGDAEAYKRLFMKKK